MVEGIISKRGVAGDIESISASKLECVVLSLLEVAEDLIGYVTVLRARISKKSRES